MSGPGPLANAHELSVRYLGSEAWVLDRVTLSQFEGHVTAIVGPSGCGKTTLIRTISALIPHCIPSEYAGSVTIAGTEICDAPVEQIAENIGYVGQNPDASIVTRCVHDEVAFPLQNLCWSRDHIEARVVEVLTQVGLLQHLWDDPWNLSGGERQRLAFAAAIAPRPRMLILDEPTSTIDSYSRRQLHALIEVMASDGCAVMVIDHDLDPLLPIIDRVIALDDAGAVIAQGAPSEVFTTHFDTLSKTGIWMPRALRSEIVSGNATPANVDLRSHSPIPTLDELVDESVAYYCRDGGSWQEAHRIDTCLLPQVTNASKEPTPVLEIEDFCVPGRSPKVSLRLCGGEFIGLIGPNAAGKSSLIAALAGLLTNHATRAVIQGRRLQRGHFDMGYVFQNPEHQLVASTVEQEVLVSGVSPERCKELLMQFHLWEHRHRHPLTLSGGQARRLSVATMVAEERQIIVFDEPTFGQDWDNTCELVAFIKDLQAQGRTIIMATHDLELALDHCTHVVALPHPMTGAQESADTTGPAATVPPPVPVRPMRKRGVFSSLNPLTVFCAVIPLAIAVLTVRNTALSLVTMAAASVLMVAIRVPWRRTLAAVVSVWAVTGALYLTFNIGWQGPMDNSPLFNLGSAATASSGIGAMMALVILSGLYATPDAVITTLTTIFRMPYRIAAAGTSAIAFLSTFQRDFTLLRTARAVRGVGSRWGVAAPVVRWLGSVVPLIILAVQHAERVALSMDSRAFGAYQTRTELIDTPWRIRDSLLVMAFWAVGAAVFITL